MGVNGDSVKNKKCMLSFQDPEVSSAKIPKTRCNEFKVFLKINTSTGESLLVLLTAMFLLLIYIKSASYL